MTSGKARREVGTCLKWGNFLYSQFCHLKFFFLKATGPTRLRKYESPEKSYRLCTGEFSIETMLLHGRSGVRFLNKSGCQVTWARI
jgi:hypothetical protein